MTTWKVLYEDAFHEWENSNPHPELSITVLLEFLRWQDAGPPDDALPVPLDEDEALFVVTIPATPLTVSYLVLDHERLVIVKDIQ